MKNVTSVFAESLVLASAVALLFSSIVSAQAPAGKTSDRVYEAGEGVTAPKVRDASSPEFVEWTRGNEVHGVVVLSLTVTAEGKVRDVRVIKSLDEDLDRKAISSVSKWKFKPGTKDGRPVAVRVRAQVDFH